mmetsp:Transcript_27034/g.46118  ORF Transcript_27034/g.46118 Transcript_27034/m.46118 type:complete len:633 (+) Transcript_27034:138-2036(+)
MASSSSSTSSPPPDDLEWEEWDSSTSPLHFSQHCLAGSFAGVAEHTLLYPLDTVKTCWQSQVLSRGAGGGAPGCGIVESCGIANIMGKTSGAATNGMNGSLSSAAPPQVAIKNAAVEAPQMPSSKTNLKIAPSASAIGTTTSSSSSMQNQGIWSTMKHLMRQGHHHQQHSHPVNHQFSHAHVYTLAGNPPNVVDLTTNTADAAKSTSSSTSNNNKKSKRPWSKQSRVLRNATIQDITAHGMIRTAGSSTSGAAIITNGANANAAGGGTTNAGFKRLWRGVQTMFVGCIPAHALYFSSYEVIKSICTDNSTSHDHVSPSLDNNEGSDAPSQQRKPQQHVGHDTLSPTQAMAAGGVATLLHDFVMTPMDTMKQRMQLGHYHNLRHAFVSIVWGNDKLAGEGWKGLYRSFPITVMTNVPYGMIMMTTNEWLRGALEDGLYGIHNHEEGENPFHFATILLSGMGAGTVASAATAPLDRVKTRLQTQRMGMALPSAGGTAGGAAGGGVGGAGSTVGTNAAIVEERALAAARGEPKVCPKMAMRDVKRTLFPSAMSAPTGGGSGIASFRPPLVSAVPTTPFQKTYYTTPLEAFQSIVQEEGPRGLFRGTLPRVALHAPSVAISWTAYEMAKDWLVWMQ